STLPIRPLQPITATRIGLSISTLSSLLRKETVLPACARFEKPAVAVVGHPKNQQHIQRNPNISRI
ncbi:hypothetical protein, partial [Aeromonas dhakensis]|uniref:hypothetical protein n=1 Tax=Aeromonas dhakensis TaxID=196024 RepID=UPI003BA28A17